VSSYLVTGGTNITATVRLSANAPTGGVVVNLALDNPIARMAGSTIFIAAGKNSAVFTVGTSRPTASTTVHLTASLGASSKVVTFTVKP
jgi:hypothetical protein